MLDNLQIHTVNVQQPNPYKGPSGGERDLFINTATNVPCRILDATSNWKIVYAQRNIELTHQVYTNQKVVIKPGYQLVFGTRIFRVIAVYQKSGTLSVTQVDCCELLNG